MYEYNDNLEDKKIYFNTGGYAHYPSSLWVNLEIMKGKIIHKHQNIVLISGTTGTGKTELAIQIAKYLDPNFSIDDIYWDTESLVNIATSNENQKPRGTVFMFDEAREGTQSINAMSETNRKMGLFLDTIRSRGYHILLLQPSFFLFQRQIAIYSSDFLFHVQKLGNTDYLDLIIKGKTAEEIGTSVEPFTRGFVSVYNYEDKKKLYIKGKKNEDMDCVKVNGFKFERSKGIVDWEEYERRKQIAVRAMNNSLEESSKDALTSRQVKVMDLKRKFYTFLRDELNWSVKEICSKFDEQIPYVINLLNDNYGLD